MSVESITKRKKRKFDHANANANDKTFYEFKFYSDEELKAFSACFPMSDGLNGTTVNSFTHWNITGYKFYRKGLCTQTGLELLRRHHTNITSHQHSQPASPTYSWCST